MREPAYCGDRKTATRPTGAGWNQTIRYSRNDGTSWMTEGVSGRLWAFAALDGRMAYWSRTSPQGPWQGPLFLPGSGIDAGATAVRLPDGRIAVFGTRTTLGTTPQAYGRDLVYAVQTAPDGAFGPWQSLGTPDTGDVSGTSAISTPAVAVDDAGRMTVYVRDSARTLRARAQADPDSGFGAWQALGGSGLQGQPVTATDAAGRRHVYAATDRSVLAWVQPTPDAPFGGPVPTGLPHDHRSALGEPAGRRRPPVLPPPRHGHRRDDPGRRGRAGRRRSPRSPRRAARAATAPSASRAACSRAARARARSACRARTAPRPGTSPRCTTRAHRLPWPSRTARPSPQPSVWTPPCTSRRRPRQGPSRSAVCRPPLRGTGRCCRRMVAQAARTGSGAQR